MKFKTNTAYRCNPDCCRKSKVAENKFTYLSCNTHEFFFLIITKCFVYELDLRHLPVKLIGTPEDQDTKVFH